MSTEQSSLFCRPLVSAAEAVFLQSLLGSMDQFCAVESVLGAIGQENGVSRYRYCADNASARMSDVNIALRSFTSGLWLLLRPRTVMRSRFRCSFPRT